MKKSFMVLVSQKKLISSHLMENYYCLLISPRDSGQIHNLQKIPVYAAIPWEPMMMSLTIRKLEAKVF